ncbi:MAG: beta-galactosidase [Candidatus Hydrogenedentota bacterium]
MRTVIWRAGLVTAALMMGMAAQGESPYAAWENGPPTDPDFFPIGVWLQDPELAPQYQEAGMNMYVGLWQGPTAEQLDALAEEEMHVICHQNETALNHPRNDIIIAWLQQDEPDNAQSREEGGYGPPVPPEEIVSRYETMRERDPSRPVHLNLGQGVAWDGWVGRGERTNHPEDYPEYTKGCDIVSFDIYPVASSRDEVQGQLWRVAHGVERLIEWSAPEQPVWSFVEASGIHTGNVAAPAEIRAEVWMALVHGAEGILYFVHEWEPAFNASALLDNQETLEGVTALNHQLRELAPVLNSSTVEGRLTVTADPEDTPVVAMLKEYDGDAYIFAVVMRDRPVTAAFTLDGITTGEVHVEETGDTLAIEEGRFEESLDGYETRLYRIPGGAS